ncbi:hypothetical protein [Enterobacter sp.]|uniref:hypothetical protein n=1 Tax=Enterobacter sp. TaxID=42895 RepID=UPI0031D1A088
MMDLSAEMAPVLAEQYADMLSLDFRSRQTQLTSLNHNLGDLMVWDLRMQAYLHGLLLLKEEAGRYFDDRLLSPLSQGDVFALGTFAFVSGNPALLEGCCRLAQALPSLLTVLGYVMEWTPVASPLWRLIDGYPALQLMAGWHRPDIRLQNTLDRADMTSLVTQAAVIPALVLALSRQSHPEYSSFINQWVISGDDRILCGVLTAILTRNLPSDGLPVQDLLRQLMLAKSENIRLQAARLALLCTSVQQNDTLHFILTQAGDIRLHIQALGIAGKAVHMTHLREYLEVPEYARLAAASISLLTGSQPEADGWGGTTPARSPGEMTAGGDIPENDPDDALTWPDAQAFEQWWRRHAQDFELEPSYLGGKPVHPSGMLHILYSGAMAMRPLAAMRWQHLTGRTLFSLSAPAPVQRQQLHGLMTQENPI